MTTQFSPGAISKESLPNISDTIVMNSSTSTPITIDNKNDTHIRTFLLLQNQGPQDIYIKFQPASVDDLKEGLLLCPGDLPVTIGGNNMPQGEFSAISTAGTPNLFVLEF